MKGKGGGAICTVHTWHDLLARLVASSSERARGSQRLATFSSRAGTLASSSVTTRYGAVHLHKLTFRHHDVTGAPWHRLGLGLGLGLGSPARHGIGLGLLGGCCGGVELIHL